MSWWCKNKIENSTSDCVVCTLNPLLKLASYIGLSPITFSCQHSKNPTKGPHFKTSKTLKCFTFFTSTILFLVVLWYGYLSATVAVEDKMLLMQLLAEIFYFLNGFTMVLFSIVFNGDKVQELNGWVKIFEARQHFGVTTILDAKVTRKTMRKGFLYCGSSCVLLFLLCIFVLTREYDGFFTWTTLRRPVCGFSTFVQMITIFEYSVKGFFLKSLFESYHNVLRDGLMARDKAGEKIGHVVTMEKTQDLEKCIKDIRQFHHAIMQNVTKFTSYLGPSLLVWMLLIVAVLIVNIYILVWVWVSGIYTSFFVMLEIRTCFMIFAIISLLKDVEEISHVVSWRWV